jgi:prephenate dehydratase
MNELLLPGKPSGGHTGRKCIISHNLAGIVGLKIIKRLNFKQYKQNHTRYIILC